MHAHVLSMHHKLAHFFLTRFVRKFYCNSYCYSFYNNMKTIKHVHTYVGGMKSITSSEFAHFLPGCGTEGKVIASVPIRKYKCS